MNGRLIDDKTQQKHRGLVDNIYIEESKEDFLIHLALTHKENNLSQLFHDVKFVCMCGTVRRISEFAKLMMFEMKQISPDLEIQDLTDLTQSGNRFSMFKVGCVLCVNHGIGYSSITIVLHEIIKLLHYANVRDPIIFRIGTSGGIGVKNGTVVVAKKAFNDFLEEYYEVPVLGKRVRLPAILDEKLAFDLKQISLEKCPDIPVITGNTMSCEHFYESVASVKASICYGDDIERKTYFDLLKQNNIVNADMEVVAISSITNHLGIKAAVVNVIVNDLSHPKEDVTYDVLLEWQTRPQRIIAEYIKRYILNSKTELP